MMGWGESHLVVKVNGETVDNPFQKLAALCQALANIFGDPKVQEAGSSLMTAVDRAIERELPEVNSLRQLADKGVDSGY